MTRRPLAPRSPISPDEAARLVVWMREVVRSDIPDRDREFCRSVLAHARRPGWHPSEKQAAWMARLVAEFQRAALGEEAPHSAAIPREAGRESPGETRG